VGVSRLPILVAAVGLVSVSFLSAAETPDQQFDTANELALAGDYPKALALYRELAASGHESASLYWNWAQAASARGASGESLWALLRARELDPGDRAVRRDVETLRESMNLDPAEIAPEPLAAAARLARRYRLGEVAAVLLVFSLLAHGAARFRPASGAIAGLGWATLGLGLLMAGLPVAGMLARPTGTVVRRGAPLLDAASPSAEAIGALREGEVVPILEAGETWVRVEDASGARGWAHVADVRRLDIPPIGPAGE
jgi:hypothetical protein